MSYTDYAAEAARHKGTADRYYRRGRRAAADAAAFYQSAGQARRDARFLTRNPDLWSADRNPASQEAYAATLTGIADHYLQRSFTATASARFYRGLMHDYGQMAVDQAARLAEARAYLAERGI